MSSDCKLAPSVFGTWGLSFITSFSSIITWKNFTKINSVPSKDLNMEPFCMFLFGLISSLSGYRFYHQFNFERKAIETTYKQTVSDIIYNDDIQTKFSWMTFKIGVATFIGYMCGKMWYNPC